MILRGVPELVTYLNELLRMKNREKQIRTIWLSTPEDPGKTEGLTSKQRRIVRKMTELKQKGKLNPMDYTVSRLNILKWFDWTDKLLTEAGKPAVEDFLTEYHNILPDKERILAWTRS